MLPMEQENKKQPVYPPTPTLTLLLIVERAIVLKLGKTFFQPIQRSNRQKDFHLTLKDCDRINR